MEKELVVLSMSRSCICEGIWCGRVEVGQQRGVDAMRYHYYQYYYYYYYYLEKDWVLSVLS